MKHKSGWVTEFTSLPADQGPRTRDSGWPRHKGRLQRLTGNWSKPQNQHLPEPYPNPNPANQQKTVQLLCVFRDWGDFYWPGGLQMMEAQHQNTSMMRWTIPPFAFCSFLIVQYTRSAGVRWHLWPTSENHKNNNHQNNLIRTGEQYKTGRELFQLQMHDVTNRLNNSLYLPATDLLNAAKQLNWLVQCFCLLSCHCLVYRGRLFCGSYFYLFIYFLTFKRHWIQALLNFAVIFFWTMAINHLL